MTRLQIAIVLTLLAGSPATAVKAADVAPAAGDANVGDVRCVVVAPSLAKSPDPRMRSLATTSGLYFIGRLDGRAPELNLPVVIAEQVKSMSADDLRREAQRCGAVLLAQGARLEAIGAVLQKSARDSGVAPSPPASLNPK